MKKSEKSAFYEYIYNNRCQLDQEVNHKKQIMRYRDIDIVDCIELALSMERRDTFMQYSKDLMELLKLYDVEELGKKGGGCPREGDPRPVTTLRDINDK